MPAIRNKRNSRGELSSTLKKRREARSAAKTRRKSNAERVRRQQQQQHSTTQSPPSPPPAADPSSSLSPAPSTTLSAAVGDSRRCSPSSSAAAATAAGSLAGGPQQTSVEYSEERTSSTRHDDDSSDANGGSDIAHDSEATSAVPMNVYTTGIAATAWMLRESSSSQMTTMKRSDSGETFDLAEVRKEKNKSNEEEVMGADVGIDVTCGENVARLFLSKLKVNERIQRKCIHFRGTWLTPNEFQRDSGREAAKDWKRTIRHSGLCLKQLLTEEVFKFSTLPPSCQCSNCTGHGQETSKDRMEKEAISQSAVRLPDKYKSSLSNLSQSSASVSAAEAAAADCEEEQGANKGRRKRREKRKRVPRREVNWKDTDREEKGHCGRNLSSHAAATAMSINENKSMLATEETVLFNEIAFKAKRMAAKIKAKEAEQCSSSSSRKTPTDSCSLIASDGFLTSGVDLGSIGNDYEAIKCALAAKGSDFTAAEIDFCEPTAASHSHSHGDEAVEDNNRSQPFNGETPEIIRQKRRSENHSISRSVEPETDRDHKDVHGRSSVSREFSLDDERLVLEVNRGHESCTLENRKDSEDIESCAGNESSSVYSEIQPMAPQGVMFSFSGDCNTNNADIRLSSKKDLDLIASNKLLSSTPVKHNRKNAGHMDCQNRNIFNKKEENHSDKESNIILDDFNQTADDCALNNSVVIKGEKTAAEENDEHPPNDGHSAVDRHSQMAAVAISLAKPIRGSVLSYLEQSTEELQLSQEIEDDPSGNSASDQDTAVSFNCHLQSSGMPAFSGNSSDVTGTLGSTSEGQEKAKVLSRNAHLVAVIAELKQKKKELGSVVFKPRESSVNAPSKSSVDDGNVKQCLSLDQDLLGNPAMRFIVSVSSNVDSTFGGASGDNSTLASNVAPGDTSVSSKKRRSSESLQRNDAVSAQLTSNQSKAKAKTSETVKKSKSTRKRANRSSHSSSSLADPNDGRRTQGPPQKDNSRPAMTSPGMSHCLATMGLYGLNPSQLGSLPFPPTPYSLYPPYLFMGFPLHPLLPSCHPSTDAKAHPSFGVGSSPAVGTTLASAPSQSVLHPPSQEKSQRKRRSAHAPNKTSRKKPRKNALPETFQPSDNVQSSYSEFLNPVVALNFLRSRSGLYNMGSGLESPGSPPFYFPTSKSESPEPYLNVGLMRHSKTSSTRIDLPNSTKSRNASSTSTKPGSRSQKLRGKGELTNEPSGSKKKISTDLKTNLYTPSDFVSVDIKPFPAIANDSTNQMLPSAKHSFDEIGALDLSIK